MPQTAWSTQQLAEFLAAVSSSQTEASAALAAVERAAEALDAEVAAIVCDGHVVAAVGYPEGAAPAAELESVTPGGAACELAVPGVGLCPATAVSLEHPPGATLVLARSGREALSREEASLLRGMARVTSMTMRTLRLLDDERAARRESDRQAAENARLLATLTERQAQIEQLADEQAALRRVATLVAGQAAADDIFAAVAEEISPLFGAEVTNLARFEPDGTATFVAGAGWTTDGWRVGNRWRPEPPSVIASVLRTGRSARVDDYSDAPEPLATVLRPEGIRAAVASPVVVERRLWGTIVVSSRRGPLPPDTERRLGDFTDLVGTAIVNAESRAQLAASRARIVATADQTRRRLERDLHDGIQQRLVALALDLHAARDAARSRNQVLPAQLSHVEDGLRIVLDELREISRGVHPAILSEGGLGPALKSLARRAALPVELEVGAVERLPERVEVAAYYVVCEALANAAKHANASVAHVDVEMREGTLQLAVRDDGVGGADPAHGSGIIGLTDRVEALGGTIAVTSPPGEGTSIVVRLPIDPAGGRGSRGPAAVPTLS